jgi:ATP-dependent Clp protease adapter protein ClpS
MADRPRSDVIMVNDNDTPMAFVVTVLERFFGMSELQAEVHMRRIHEEGMTICGTYWQDVAEKKVKDVLAFARGTSIRSNAWPNNRTSAKAAFSFRSRPARGPSCTCEALARCICGVRPADTV